MADSTTWVDDTRAAVDRASNEVQAQSDLEALDEADAELDRALDDLEQLRTAANLGHGTWWHGSDVPPDLWAALAAARKDPASRNLRAITRRLNDYRRDVRSAVQGAWRDHVASRTGNALDLRKLVQVLSGARGLAEIAHSLEEALGKLARLQNSVPDAQAVATLDEAVDLLGALEAQLPDAVRAFVSAAARGGASLELLDADVLAWLASHGAVDNFKIVPGQPQEARRG